MNKSMKHLQLHYSTILHTLSEYDMGGYTHVLDDMFRLQKQLQEKISELHPEMQWPITDANRAEVTKQQFVNIIMECCEALEEAGWKTWTLPQELNRFELLMEVADIMHFVLNICLALDITPNMLVAAYMTKNSENIKRQLGQSPDSAVYVIVDEVKNANTADKSRQVGNNNESDEFLN